MQRSLFLLAFVALSIIGCNSGGATTDNNAAPSTNTAGGGNADKKLRIAFIPKGSTHEFWKAMQAGAEEAAKANNVELLWKGPEKEDDKADQISTVQSFTSQGVNGIILAPLDAEALKNPSKEAMAKGIKMIIVDSDLKGAETESFIATDNKKAGYMGGERLAKALGGKGKVIMLRYAEGSASTEAREAGFLEAAKAGGLTVVSENQHGGATRETAQTASESLLQTVKTADGLSIQGIFCPNESTAFGMMKALQNARLMGKVKFVGFDSSKELLDGVASGDIEGLVLQNPGNMGKLAVENMVKVLKGEKIEKRIDTGATLVDKANLDSAEVKALLGKK